MDSSASIEPSLPADYGELLDRLKAEVRAAQLRAHRAVNVELVDLYWRIGRTILERQDAGGWGAKVIDRLAADLRGEFPALTGLSRSNLHYMRSFAHAWPEVVPQAVGQLPWGHVRVLIDKLDDRSLRDWYAAQTIEHGWSRAVLANMVASQLHERIGTAPTNFTDRLAPDDGELAGQMVRDPYNFEFLGLTGRVLERDLEQALMDRLQRFLLELGAGFSLYGRQYRFELGGDDFVMDLVFFNVDHDRFVIVELKVGAFAPAQLGQLQFYVEWAERHLRQERHQPTIGILLVEDRNDLVVRYALAAAQTPLAVATYTYDTLPAAARQELPGEAELSDAVHDAYDQARRLDRDDDDGRG